MKIKWNWGTKLGLFMFLFMLLILSFVFRTFQHPIMLVEKDYYPKGLRYQDRIDERKNAQPFEKQFQIEQRDGQVMLHFPDILPDTGNVNFFRPSNNKFDYQVNMAPKIIHQMAFDDKNFKKGKYVLKIYWEEKGKKFYVERGFYFHQ